MAITTLTHSLTHSLTLDFISGVVFEIILSHYCPNTNKHRKVRHSSYFHTPLTLPLTPSPPPFTPPLSPRKSTCTSFRDVDRQMVD